MYEHKLSALGLKWHVSLTRSSTPELSEPTATASLWHSRPFHLPSNEGFVDKTLRARIAVDFAPQFSITLGQRLHSSEAMGFNHSL